MLPRLVFPALVATLGLAVPQVAHADDIGAAAAPLSAIPAASLVGGTILDVVMVSAWVDDSALPIPAVTMGRVFGYMNVAFGTIALVGATQAEDEVQTLLTVFGGLYLAAGIPGVVSSYAVDTQPTPPPVAIRVMGDGAFVTVSGRF